MMIAFIAASVLKVLFISCCVALGLAVVLAIYLANRKDKDHFD